MDYIKIYGNPADTPALMDKIFDMSRVFWAGCQAERNPKEVAAEVMRQYRLRVRLWEKAIAGDIKLGAEPLMIAAGHILQIGAWLYNGGAITDENSAKLAGAAHALQGPLSRDVIVRPFDRESPALYFKPTNMMMSVMNARELSMPSAGAYVPASLTPGQEAAMRELRVLYNARFSQIAADGIFPYCHALVVGSSGSGKTFLARELAMANSIPWLEITAGGWILEGSTAARSTLSKVAAWAEKATATSKAILIIDEIDKVRMPSDGGSNSVWVRCMYDELLGLFDGRTMKAEHWDRLFIVGAGAFQDLYRRAAGDKILIDEQWTDIAIMERLWSAGVLPDELLSRLAPGAIEIPAPSADWLAARLERIEVELLGKACRSTAAYQQMASEMVRSRRNMRSLESWVIDCYRRSPEGYAAIDRAEQNSRLGGDAPGRAQP